MTRCHCAICDREVPAHIDGTPKPHQTIIHDIEIACHGGSHLDPILMSDPMALALRLGLKTSTMRRSDKWGSRRAGDRLWVREAYMETPEGVIYRADGNGWSHPWSHAMFAPYRVSRTHLRLTHDPVQIRPCDLTQAQVMEEGVQVLLTPLFRLPETGRRHWLEATRRAWIQDWHGAFSWLWSAINGPESYNEPAWLLRFEVRP